MGAAVSGSVCLALALTCAYGCTKGTDATTVDSSPLPDPAATTLGDPTTSGAPDARENGSTHAASPPYDRAVTKSYAAAPRLASSASAPPGTVVPAARPLAEWMRGPLTEAFSSGDLESIAGSFERMEAWAPVGYANWRSIADDGARAARAGRLDAVRAACRGCHAQYEARYKQERTNQPLPL